MTMLDISPLPFLPPLPQAKTQLLPLELHNIHYRTGKKNLLRNINFKLSGNHITVIMGPNGAGKTLLLHIIHGLKQATQGHITSNDSLLNQQLNSLTSIVLQNPMLFRRSVRDNLKVALKAANIPSKQYKQTIQALLKWSNLFELQNQAARLLSGGEKQCLSIARSLVSQPQLLLLDEPCANLDQQATQKIEALIKQTAGAGVKICLVTHDNMQANRLADEIIFINRGEVCEITPREQFFLEPQSREARQYLRGELIS